MLTTVTLIFAKAASTHLSELEKLPPGDNIKTNKAKMDLHALAN
jgi:hypothetical protein